MTWRAKTSVGWALSLLVAGSIVALDAWLLNRLLNSQIRVQQISFVSFLMGLTVLLSVPVLLFLLYQALGSLTLRYRLDRNGVTIRWAGTEQIIPIRDIQRIVPGRGLGDTVVRRRGLHWPGHERGEGSVPGIGRTCFLATQPLSRQLLLVTPGLSFAISPADPVGFQRAFSARRELGPNRLLEQERHPAR